MTRALAFVTALLVVACTTPPAPTEPAPVIHLAPPPIVKEAAKTTTASKRYVEKHPEMSSAELIHMLDLRKAMDGAVARAKAHRTRANIKAAKNATTALRGFMAKGAH